MSMHLSPFDDLDRSIVSNREPRARRIGEILSILFLVSLGTVATVTSTRAGAHEQADAQVSATALSSATAR
jgi:hypothetical protein